MTDHPITPPPELVEQWIKECDNPEEPRWQEYEQDIATLAARWGADQELDACCKWLDAYHTLGPSPMALQLRTARRPKPPSLKEQALAALDDAIMRGDCITISDALPTLRRALEQLDD